MKKVWKCLTDFDLVESYCLTSPDVSILQIVFVFYRGTSLIQLHALSVVRGDEAAWDSDSAPCPERDAEHLGWMDSQLWEIIWRWAREREKERSENFESMKITNWSACNVDKSEFRKWDVQYQSVTFKGDEIGKKEREKRRYIERKSWSEFFEPCVTEWGDLSSCLASILHIKEFS